MFNDGIRKCIHLYNNNGALIASYYIEKMIILEGRFIFTIKFDNSEDSSRALFHFENCSRDLVFPKIRIGVKELYVKVYATWLNLFYKEILTVEIRMPGD